MHRAAVKISIAIVCFCAALSVAAMATAAAQPVGNATWMVLEGTCGGHQVQLLDPLGGNTAFLVGGSVIVGKRFKATDLTTGEILLDSTNGRGLGDDRLTHCSFVGLGVPGPGGPTDILFEVWALFTPQGG